MNLTILIVIVVLIVIFYLSKHSEEKKDVAPTPAPIIVQAPPQIIVKEDKEPDVVSYVYPTTWGLPWAYRGGRRPWVGYGRPWRGWGGRRGGWGGRRFRRR